MQAVAYCRLSNKDQSTYSIDNQLRGINEYCDKYNLTLADTFIDNGESSYTFDRADFKKLEIYIKKHRPQYLVVYHLDRFSRNLAEALQKTRELLDKYNVRVRDISEPPELDDADPNVFMIRSFRFMMAEGELHRIRQRIKAGMLQGAINGRHLNMAPYGYTNGRDDQNKPILLINEDKAFHIQIIFKEFIAGNSIEEVRRIARLFGFKQTGNSAIQTILANAVYIGKIKIPNSPKLAQGLHQPIISEFDFYKAQDLLNGRKGITTQPKEDVFLRGVLKDYAGNVMTAGNSRSRSGKYYWYYVSKTNRQNFSAVKIHAQFLQLLNMLSFTTAEMKWFKAKMLENIAEKQSTQTDTAKKLTHRLAEIKIRIEKTEEKYLLNADISPATYKKVVNNLHKEQTEIQQNLLSNNTDTTVMLDKLHQLLPLLTNLQPLFLQLPLHKQQQFIRTVFDNSLAYYNECYRTPYLHPIFATKAALLNENRLLIIEQPVVKMGETPLRTPARNPIEQITDILLILVA